MHMNPYMIQPFYYHCRMNYAHWDPYYTHQFYQFGNDYAHYLGVYNCGMATNSTFPCNTSGAHGFSQTGLKYPSIDSPQRRSTVLSSSTDGQPSDVGITRIGSVHDPTSTLQASPGKQKDQGAITAYGIPVESDEAAKHLDPAIK